MVAHTRLSFDEDGRRKEEAEVLAGDPHPGLLGCVAAAAAFVDLSAARAHVLYGLQRRGRGGSSRGCRRWKDADPRALQTATGGAVSIAIPGAAGFPDGAW